MQRPGKNDPCFSVLHELAGVHHGHLAGCLGDDAQIVGNEDHRCPQFALKLFHEFQDLCLNRYIKSGCGLIGDHKAGSAGQRHGDHHPLAHPAAQLMRIVSHPLFRFSYTHRSQHLHRPLPYLPPCATLVQPQCLPDLVADTEDRVQGGHGFLKDHRNRFPPDFPHLFFRQAEEIMVA